MDNTTVTEAPEVPKITGRLAIRDKILSSEAESEFVDAFGVRIEIRYPSLEDLLQYRDAQNDDNIMARAIINNCYDPDSGERIFEDTDVEVIMKKKFTPDMRRLNTAINKILGGDEEVLKNIEDEKKGNKG